VIVVGYRGPYLTDLLPTLAPDDPNLRLLQQVRTAVRDLVPDATVRFVRGGTDQELQLPGGP
jgi:hypothetical protein